MIAALYVAWIAARMICLLLPASVVFVLTRRAR